MPTRRLLLALIAAPALSGTLAPAQALVAAARRQIGVTVGYDPAYRALAYPGGDPPRATGVCTDVVIRAARDAFGLDLQKLVHEDMRQAFSAYPRRWGLSGPDRNIDHRRAPNLDVYWTRRGGRLWRASAAAPTFAAVAPRPGDLLTWRSFLGAGPHVAIVSRGGAAPWVIQNYGSGVREEPLARFLAGAEAHYRWLPSSA